MITLVLEASTYAGSVAVIDRARVVAERAVAMRGREHEALMPAVAAVLAEAKVSPGAIERVVCGAGPGSFTSLRIAGAIAKGLALAACCPLVPVSSLALVVASREPFAPGRYLAAIDALRGEHYVGLFEVGVEGNLRALGPELRVSSAEVLERAAEHDAIAVGPGREGAAHVDPRAAAAARLADLLDASPAADLAGWEPAYGRLAEAQVKWEAAHGRSLEAV
ncbi:MAG TPA: tRNA (adenosine(37)-N6)-threonylcarbamoyltransferase complex dimerization subunit type 1 TsaB [Gemmatimonadaceae bacterium]|nr:tRNA (adenosine(37)-N6)-threonylcarbamoyltransferase complex dimerization subunit type 1 TsaB [Gemmatimonadaceae bacterium]